MTYSNETMLRTRSINTSSSNNNAKRHSQQNNVRVDKYVPWL